jgi:2-oxoacid:acceptor oxidoreductase delta subunit (pyruvate/2-ketoisovalerate family)
MSVAIGAEAAGARAYTATASQGLLYMSEAVYNAAGLGLPVVLTVANRAIGAPINIWNDHSDAMSQRDAGWIQLYAETNQEAADLHIQAFRIAEELSNPVMVCMDGFLLTHASERVDIPAQTQVDAFLPPYEPRQVLDPDDPVSIGAMVGPEAFTEVRYLAFERMRRALEVIPAVEADFGAQFGRGSGGLVKLYRTDDADLAVLDGVPGVTFSGGTVDVGADLMTGHQGIFAGGDMVPAERTVTVAIGHGKKAARNIDAWLRGARLEPAPRPAPAGYGGLNTWYYADAPATVRPRLAAARRTGTFDEVTGGLDESTALFEARRCMSCGNCFGCDNCYGACPDAAILKNTGVIKTGPGGPGDYEIDYDYCKGCGICAAECPCGAIAMVPEEP